MEQVGPRLFVFIVGFLLALGLNASVAVYFEHEPRDVEVIEGGLAILSCTVADIGEAKLYWRYVDVERGSLVPLSEDRNIEKYQPVHGELSKRLSITGDPNHGEYNLLIKNISIADEREYVCSVITRDWTAHDSRRARIIVWPRPPVDSQKPNPRPACTAEVVTTPRVFQIGSVVRFTCALPSGTPDQTLVWSRVEQTRTHLLSCPRSPCIHNQLLTIDDANTTFACEASGQSPSQEPIECTFTPLEIQIGVVVSPVVSRVPAGQREGFLCLPINYSPSSLMFKWYRQSQLIPNGTGMSLLNLLIDWSYADSRISCVISSIDGTFRGIGHALIQPFDPRDEFLDVEGSSSPVISGHVTEQVTEKQTINHEDIIRTTYVIPVTYSPSLTVKSGLSKQPRAESGRTPDSSKHLSMLVVVSAIAGALVTLFLCALGLVVLLFIRKRRKTSISVQENGTVHKNTLNECGNLELRSVDNRDKDSCNYFEIYEKQPTTYSGVDGGSDLFYATLDPSSEEQYVDRTLSMSVSQVNQPTGLGPPSTPNDYARPQTTPLEESSQQHEGMVNQGFSRSHERTLSDSSAHAYAVTDLVSQEGRFVFKGMTGRDEAAVGVCCPHALERSATMSKALDRNPSAPPLPARTLPRTLSTPEGHGSGDNLYNQQRQSDSKAVKDKASGNSKKSFVSRWPWSGKGKKSSSKESSVVSHTEENIPMNGDDNRPLSFGSGASGDYAEIVSLDSMRSGSSQHADAGGSPNKRQSITREKLDSIPERVTSSTQYHDLDAYIPSADMLESQPMIGKDTSMSSGYDQLARPNQVATSPVKVTSSIPIYAKVQKSKSLDHDCHPRKLILGDGTTSPSVCPSGSRGRPATTMGMSHLLRSMSEGTAPAKGRKPRSVCGYEAVAFEYETADGSEKLNSILVQMRNGFPGVDEPEEEGGGEDGGGEIKNNTGGHLAKIV